MAESEQPQSRAKRAAKNRREKRELVERGRAHGILVYSNGEPVGWCQYGPREELPRVDSSHAYRRLALESNTAKHWRITCFVVHTRHRNRGVARAALKAALEAIRKKGGGLVEAYPIVRSGAYQEYLGSVSMFRKEGFKIVAPLGKSNVVMRRKT
ncbi:MAG: GNAT family N-acetyltransferase [Methanobacteriota archaeon]